MSKYTALFRYQHHRIYKLVYPYVYVNAVYLKRSWGSEIQNVSILVVIGVIQDGCWEILGAAEDMKGDLLRMAARTWAY